MTPVFWNFADEIPTASEKRTLSALCALFDIGAPPAPLRCRRSTYL